MTKEEMAELNKLLVIMSEMNLRIVKGEKAE